MRLESRELLPGHVSVTPILFGDPAYPLLLNVMKEFNNCTETKHVLFDNKLRATRYQIECAFERLKSPWRVLNTAVDVDTNFAVKLVYACFILNNFSACNRAGILYDVVQEKMGREHLVQSCSHYDNFDKLHSHNTSRSKLVREANADYLYDKYNS